MIDATTLPPVPAGVAVNVELVKSGDYKVTLPGVGRADRDKYTTVVPGDFVLGQIERHVAAVAADALTNWFDRAAPNVGVTVGQLGHGSWVVTFPNPTK